MRQLPSHLRRLVERIQRDEITEYEIYTYLARREKNPERARLLQKIAMDEYRHYNFWRGITGKDMKPSAIKKFFYLLLAGVFPLSFVLKLMEKGETASREKYEYIAKVLPEAVPIVREEHEHELDLLSMIEEDILKYISSVVLGMNDALVEIIGALAGMSQAIRDSTLIAVAAFLTGFAASLSMASAEYLSTKEEMDAGEERAKKPLKAATVTGLSYILVVAILVLPFVFIRNVYLSLGVAVLSALGIIALFNFLVSVVRDRSFWRSFIEMLLILVAVTFVSGVVGWVVREAFGIDI